MTSHKQNRRDFLKTTSAAAIAGSTPFWFSTQQSLANNFKAASERPVVGCIGTGSRWNSVGYNAMKFGDCVAVCDADSNHANAGQKKVLGIQKKKGSDRHVDVYEDYRKILERKDIEVVTIVTPDHWHTKIAVEAMKAGKDVYCEKPLTLTIDEGKIIRKVQEETGRVFQVGTQQRSEMGQRFLQALGIVKEGRLGDIKKVVCGIGGVGASGPLKKEPVPKGLNWELWQGQTQLVDYIPRRCHYEFRWWYEYSGGKMTDWGAHHVDIAQWAIGMDHSGPTLVEPVKATHPVPLKNGYPTKDNEYNVATSFVVRALFPNKAEMEIRSDTDNGILIEGTKGRMFVSRGSLKGKPVEDLEKNPLAEDTIKKLYKGKQPGDHMGNFMECVKLREEPISDVKTHHRTMTTCHLANIAIRLNRSLNWNPETEMIEGDSDAAKWQSREQRKGYEIEA
jgi:predicted dehydrogenase